MITYKIHCRQKYGFHLWSLTTSVAKIIQAPSTFVEFPSGAVHISQSLLHYKAQLSGPLTPLHCPRLHSVLLLTG